VLRGLGPGATTVLVDAECGPGLLADYPDGCAPMLAYEADVYHISEPERITVLPEGLSIADYPAMGVGQLKFFMYYAPGDDPALNARKRRLVEEVGTECARHGVRFLLEPLVYDRALEPGTPEFARAKPELVRRATAVFAEPSFRADVLKVEVPVDLAFVEGGAERTAVMTRAEAMEAFRAAAEAAGGTPLVYLSAGVPFARFEESLRLAREAGVRPAGFMCGRALWADAIAVFGKGGSEALESWLAGEGRRRLERLKAAL